MDFRGTMITSFVKTFGPVRGATVLGLLEQEQPSNYEELCMLLGPEEADDVMFCMEVEMEEKLRRMAKLQSKGEVRARYLANAVLKYTGERWNFDRTVQGVSLMQAIVEHHRPGAPPVALPLINEAKTPEEPELPQEELEKFWENGFVVNQSKWAWDTRSLGWKLLVKAFPNAVEAAAYSNRLMSPTIPNGIHLNQQVRLVNIKTIDGLLAECDGSGRVHPRVLEAWGLPIRTVQWSFLAESGLFMKGILVPDERCLGPGGEPEIWADYAQIKGLHKPKFDKGKPLNAAAHLQSKDESHIVKGHIGLLQMWNRPSWIHYGFEVLENILQNPDTEEIFERAVERAISKLVEEGPDKLAAKVAEDKELAAYTLQLLTAWKKFDQDVSPMSIPWLREAVCQKLTKMLWWFGQGAGKKSRSYVAVIDAGVPKGKCVMMGPKPGTKVAAFRFPVVLAQVLTTLEVVEPLPHHLVNGELVPFTIYLNPHDITSRMMGDDDGDTVGISWAKEDLVLWSNLVDDNIYLIEPEGEKLNIPTNSPKGWQYMAHDNRGSVGPLTLLRSRLLAVGDVQAANAVSILIQEAIDRAKRAVVWTDWRKAVNLENWIEENGKYRLKKFRPAHTTNGHVTMPMVYRWVYDQLILAGVPYTTEVVMRNGQEKVKRTPVEVLGWRNAGKAIDPDNWLPTTTHQSGWAGGNLIHHVFDHGAYVWLDKRELLKLDAEELQSANLVHEVACAAGAAIKLPEMSWYDYNKGLRKRAGINALSDTYRRSWNHDDEDVRRAMLDMAVDRVQECALELNVEELVTIWWMEFSHQEEWGNPNYAYYSLCTPGNALMELMGVKDPNCNFLRRFRKTKQNAVNAALAAERPMEKLVELIQNSTGHGKHVKDESGLPVEGWQCQHCTEELQTALVRAIRKKGSRKEFDFAKALLAKLN